MKKNNFYIDIVPVLVEEVFEEVGHALQRDVTTDHNVPAERRWKIDEKQHPRLQTERGTEEQPRQKRPKMSRKMKRCRRKMVGATGGAHRGPQVEAEEPAVDFQPD